MTKAFTVSTSTIILGCALAGLSIETANAGQAAPQHKEAEAGITGLEAFSLLKEGNQRFANEKATHVKQDKETRNQLLAGQKPHTIVISCSDSRVPPEIVFDQGLGQIFTIRSAGEVLDYSAIASVEYAVEHLGAKLIVVLGHESCGAVKAALSIPPGTSAGSSHLDKMVEAIRPGVERFKSAAADDKLLRAPVKANVFAVAKSLMKRSKLLRDAVNERGLHLVQGVYSLGSGEVEFSEDMGKLLVQMVNSEEKRNVASEKKSSTKQTAYKNDKKHSAANSHEWKKHPETHSYESKKHPETNSHEWKKKHSETNSHEWKKHAETNSHESNKYPETHSYESKKHPETNSH